MLLFGILLRGGQPAPVLTTSGLASADPTNSISDASDGFSPISGLQLKTTGQVADSTGTSQAPLVYVDQGPWINNLGNSSLYEARATAVSADAGGTFTGPQTWTTLSSNITWTWTKDADTAGTVSVVFNVQIREIADTSNIVTYTNYNMDATENPGV